MKKLFSALLGVSLIAGVGSLALAEDQPKAEKTVPSKSTKGKKKGTEAVAAKTDAPKEIVKETPVKKTPGKKAPGKKSLGKKAPEKEAPPAK